MIRRIKEMIGKKRILPARIRSDEEVNRERTAAHSAHYAGLRAKDGAMAEFRKVEHLVRGGGQG